MTRAFLQDYDVLVAGGGPSGIAAAVAAARQGAKTALVERYGILGGMLTSGHVNPILGATAPGTLLEEVLSRLGVNRMRTRNGEERGFDAEGAKQQRWRWRPEQTSSSRPRWWRWSGRGSG